MKALDVQIRGDRIIVNGHTDSYYAVQLANVGVLETLNRLDLDWPDKVEFNIEVDARNSTSIVEPKEGTMG